MHAKFQPRTSIVYVGSAFHPNRIRGNRAPRFYRTFQTSSGNETNDDGVVGKCHHDFETMSDDCNVVVNGHHDYDTRIDECYVVV
uniref:Uncharacterized protein n=1 Tax=Peronospora matthiolae TaxID=2874970 RepID=A0AAV1VGK8_9STRA